MRSLSISYIIFHMLGVAFFPINSHHQDDTTFFRIGNFNKQTFICHSKLPNFHLTPNGRDASDLWATPRCAVKRVELVWKVMSGLNDICLEYTPPETNVAPKNGWLEYNFPIGEAYFQGQTVSFREGTLLGTITYPPVRFPASLSR